MGDSGTIGGRPPKRAHDIVVPFGFLFLAAFVFFSAWGWISIDQAQEWRQGTCAASAPPAASCRSVGTATVTGTFVHVAGGVDGSTIYGVTYTGHGRIPDYSVNYSWGSPPDGMVPIPKKNQVIGVTTWQGRPVFLTFSGLTVTVSTPPDKDPLLVAGFADIAALAAVCTALIGRPLPYTRKALIALRVVDWVWLPALVAGFVLVSMHIYEPGLLAIEVGGGLAFTVSQALRLRVAFRTRRGWPSVGDDASAPPPPGAKAERERERARTRTRTRTFQRGCPLPPDEQHWVESEMAAFVKSQGGAKPTILLRKGFYPKGFDHETLLVEELARKLCGLMGVDADSVLVRLVDGRDDWTRIAQSPDAPYNGHFDDQTYDPRTGLFTLELDGGLDSEPALLTAIIAHELGHIRLRRAPERLPSGRRLEQQVDLLVIAAGLGLFGANVALRPHPGRADEDPTSLGGLSPQMYAYALACTAWLRDERQPTWTSQLKPAVREHFGRSMDYLAAHAGGGGLPTVFTLSFLRPAAAPRTPPESGQ